MEPKKVFRGNDTLFYNSQCLFVEYHDVIAIPWFTLLAFVKNTNLFQNIFNMEDIAEYDLTGLLEWYIYRKHRNIFKSIGAQEGIDTIPDEGYATILEKAMSISDDIYKIPTNLKFLSSLRLLLEEASLVKQVIIYSEKNEPMIETTLKQYFLRAGGKIQYVYGNFEDIAKSIPSDATYVFSDIEKINILKKLNKLHLSCILIPSGLRYNYLEDNPTKLKVDLDELVKNFVFKYSFFDNFDLSNALNNNQIPSELSAFNQSDTSQTNDE